MSEHFLSRITLSPPTAELSALAQLALSNLYHAHQLVWRFFPQLADSRGRRATGKAAAAPFLFRHEEIQRRHCFYIVSTTPPQPDELLWHCETKPYAPQITNGDRLAFTVRVNPTITVAGKRHDLVAHRKKPLIDQYGKYGWTAHISQAELLWQVADEWMNRRGEQNGFALEREQLVVNDYVKQVFHGRNNHQITLGVLNLRGLLTVTDTERFQQVLLNGIGRAQGFGMGLMLVRRV